MPPSDVAVRVARADEHAALAAAYQAWGYGGGIAPGDRVYVAEVGDALAGIVRRTREHGVAMLRGMQVAPEHRRRGVGTQLLTALVDELGGEPCYCVPYAQLTAFYGSAGFEFIDRHDVPPFLVERVAGYRADGLDVLVMRRP